MASKKFFILASISPRRRKLLKAAGYRFHIIPSRTSERHPQGLTPSQLVQYLALKKARAVSKKHPLAIVLGADTLVFLNRKPIGKPKSKSNAVRMLRRLSGVWQHVYTGVSVVWQGGKRFKTGYALSHVKMRILTEKEIKHSVTKNMDKAGAYAIQAKRDPFVEELKGDYDNVVGLPLRVVKRLLRFAR